MFENIRIENGNFSVGSSGSTFFTMDHESNEMLERNSSGVTVAVYFLDTDIIEVQSLQYDGYYFWSLEKQGTSGFRLRKWEVTESNLVSLVDTLSYATDSINKYDVNTFAVEAYSDSLSSNILVGQSTFTVTDGSVIRIGDNIVIGPSTAVGHEGNVVLANVINKVGTSITISPSSGVQFNPGDNVTFSRSLFVFSDTAPGNQPGALYKYRSRDGSGLALDVENTYNSVTAATFFKGTLMFVKAGEVLWIDPDTFNLTKSQAVDNLDVTRSTHNQAFDLTGFSNTLYRLEQEHVSFNETSEEYETEDWSPQYNYNVSSVLAVPYFVSVKAEPPILHKFTTSIPVADLQSVITVQVLDQFRTPVFNQLVDLTSTGGPLSPIQATTDANGEITSTYTADSSVGAVTIEATVT
jgi:hypothetical protein